MAPGVVPRPRISPFRPPDFSDPALLANRSDEEIQGRLRDSARHTPMAIAAVLQEDAFRDALAYLRTLSVPAKHVSLLAGRDIYQGSCWVCHGVRGDGKGPAGNVDPPPQDFTSPDVVIEGREEEVYRAISTGAAASFHGSACMPEWGTRLSPQQIRDMSALAAGGASLAGSVLLIAGRDLERRATLVRARRVRGRECENRSSESSRGAPRAARALRARGFQPRVRPFPHHTRGPRRVRLRFE
jgi:mono/diheme cytochrome c family protein